MEEHGCKTSLLFCENMIKLGLRQLAVHQVGEGALRQRLKMYQTQQHIQAHCVTGYAMWAAFCNYHTVRKNPFPPPSVN